MITENISTELYRRMEEKYRVSRSRSGPMAFQGDDVEMDADLQTIWKSKLLQLEERLLDETLFHLHTLFDFSQHAQDIQKAVQDAFKQLKDSERRCSQGGEFDVETYAFFLFRNLWHQGLSLDSASLLTGMGHLTRTGFFQKIPQEITTWTQRFLYIERYHRLDALESESRIERYRFLESASQRSAKSIKWSFEDVVTWLERQLVARQAGGEADLGRLSHDLAKRLEDVLPGDFFHGDPFQPVVFVLLKCHEFCLAETIEPVEWKHIDRIHAKRQMDSVLDLMRLVIMKTTHLHPLPEVGSILDQLQDEGFEIEHRGFRDPYEAKMVPLADAERLDSTLLPLFLPVRDLHGQYETDLDLCRSILTDRHNELVKEIIGECEAHQSGNTQPLPKALAIPRMVRFAVSWSLAQFPWLPSQLPPDFTENVLKRLPSSAIRLLVRQRKGYEVNSRSAMTAMVDLEIRRQWEVLQRIAESGRIFGLHDYAQFARFALFRDAVRRLGPDPGPDLSRVLRFIREDFSLESVAAAGKRRGIDTQQAEHHSLESAEEYVRRVVPVEMIKNKLSMSFEVSENQRTLITTQVEDKAVSAFYRLLVAYERHRLQLPRLSATTSQIPWMVMLLAPPTVFLQEELFGDLEQEFRKDPSRLLRTQHAPCLLDAGEWKAYLAWQTHRIVGGHPKRYLEEGDLDGLLSRLSREAAKVELMPGALMAENIQATLVEFLKPGDKTPPGDLERLKELTPLLPQLNCAACGRMNCVDFAGSLMSGRSQPQQCPHLIGDKLEVIIETLTRSPETTQEEVKGRGSSLLQQLSERASWRNSTDKANFRNALSVKSQKARQLFLDQLRKMWEDFPTKPDIFKCPEPEDFYHELRKRLGYQAVERIREDERSFLIEHGDKRSEVEWQRLKQDQDWLTFADRARRSRPKLQSQDPESISAQYYGNISLLDQLSARDRSLVLRRRLEEYQDGFGHWWNEDLLTMNLPDYRIRDWDDFSKIIKNAYWHQESSLAVMDVFDRLQLEFFSDLGSPQLAAVLLKDWLRERQAAASLRATQLREFRENIGKRKEMHDVETLRGIIDALADEADLGGACLAVSQLAPISEEPTSEDRMTIERLTLWEAFQKEGFLFSRNFSCRWDELTAGEMEFFKKSSGDRADFSLVDWRAPLRERKQLILALISACLKKRSAERAECPWAELAPVALQDDGDVQTLPEIDAFVQKLLQSNPSLAGRTVEDALCEAIHVRLYESIRPSKGLAECPGPSRRLQVLQEVCPSVIGLVDRLIEHQRPMDRERMFHYLFLLAKMEGNLDALTALLREIRETSDIIEAAWLRFTEERLSRAGSPKALAGLGLGMPLLASTIKIGDAVNEALCNGISRRANKDVATAYDEIVRLIRYHVLLELERNGSLEQVLEEMRNTGYDLSCLSEEGLKAAARREWDRRERFRDQKIWIFATVVARRLAAQHRGLYEAERDFHKIRSDLLKNGRDGVESYGEIMSRRGVALGQIKEEMYRMLSDLLENERILSFQRRIRQIVGQLDEKRERIYLSCLKGEVNRETVFYVLRQYQKSDRSPTWDDFQRFLRNHWFMPLAEFRSTPRHDREERISELDRRFESLLGVSLLKLEADSNNLASHEIDQWADQEFRKLRTAIGGAV